MSNELVDTTTGLSSSVVEHVITLINYHSLS